MWSGDRMLVFAVRCLGLLSLMTFTSQQPSTSLYHSLPLKWIFINFFTHFVMPTTGARHEFLLANLSHAQHQSVCHSKLRHSDSEGKPTPTFIPKRLQTFSLAQKAHNVLHSQPVSVQLIFLTHDEKSKPSSPSALKRSKSSAPKAVC